MDAVVVLLGIGLTASAYSSISGGESTVNSLRFDHQIAALVAG